MRTYTELSKLTSFEDRFRYLLLGGEVGQDTFGFDRYLNQMFYRSPEWKSIRQQVIIRDEGRDLGIPGHEIGRRFLIHHMNPITARDILDRSELLMDPEYLILVSHETHNAIHYGDCSILERDIYVERTPNDQCPWRK